MFVYTVRASTIRFFGILVLTVALLFGILVFGGRGSAVTASAMSVDFSGLKTNDDRVAFISKFGIEVEEAPVETVDFRVPDELDRVLSEYNEIQRMQGLDISKYKNKKVTRYTYLAENYPESEGEIYVNLIIYKGTVIACDISSADPDDGFLAPLVRYK